MAKRDNRSVRRAKAKPAVKRQLIVDAGGRCANPACQAWKAHVHHVKHWGVYRTQNGAAMIAVCPTCLDEIHCGKLGLSDNVVQLWAEKMGLNKFFRSLPKVPEGAFDPNARMGILGSEPFP